MQYKETSELIIEENNIIDISKYKKYQIHGQFREFKERYEYIILDEYEDYLDFCSIHIIPIGDVSVQLLEFTDEDDKDHVYVASIEFIKNNFSLRNALDWLNKYSVTCASIEDDGEFIYKANKIIKGIRFKNVLVLLYEKGNMRIKCEGDYIEITQAFKPLQEKIDSRQSKPIQLDKSNNRKTVTYDDKKNYGAKIIYNDELIDHIPILYFDKYKDLVISNGNVVLCDYIAPYKDKYLGFYQGRYKEGVPALPISFLLDMDTTIYITVEVRLDGSKFCVITYNYIIDNI